MISGTKWSEISKKWGEVVKNGCKEVRYGGIIKL